MTHGVRDNVAEVAFMLGGYNGGGYTLRCENERVKVDGEECGHISGFIDV